MQLFEVTFNIGDISQQRMVQQIQAHHPQTAGDMVKAQYGDACNILSVIYL